MSQPVSAPCPLPDYCVAHLFVLIGENPLPAYVAAWTMLKRGGTLYPIYTSRTERVLDHLQATLAPSLESGAIKAIEPVALNDYESDAFYIVDAVERMVKHINKDTQQGDRSIGLNYTGGTAPMGVHSYNTLRHLRSDTVFSYLDPRRLEMCVDRLDGERIRRPVSLAVPLDDLIGLHGLRRDLKRDYGKPVMVSAAREMAALQADKDEQKSWRAWCEGELKEKAQIYGKWKSNDRLQGVTLDLGTLSEEHKQILNRYFGATKDKLSLGAFHNVFGSSRDICEWLDGKWLESYVLDQVTRSGGDIGGSVRSAHIPRQDGSGQDQFEFDVAFVVGYQLFGISCTTSADRKLCKSKLLEAYVRVRQLGGDEARTGLVCMHTDTRGLKEELALVLPNDKIAVFGPRDLLDLSAKIAAWVGKTSGSAS